MSDYTRRVTATCLAFNRFDGAGEYRRLRTQIETLVASVIEDCAREADLYMADEDPDGSVADRIRALLEKR
jgi:hypothetical protein